MPAAVRPSGASQAPGGCGALFEPLEGRRLFSAVGGAIGAGPADGAPHDLAAAAAADEVKLRARLSGPRSVKGGDAYAFKVTYRSAVAIDVSTVEGGDVAVTGPLDYFASGELMTTKANRKGTKVVATYRVNAPGGAFDPGDNGTYTVRLNAGAVRTTALPDPPPTPGIDYAPYVRTATNGAADLGTFKVRAKPGRAGSDTPGEDPDDTPFDGQARLDAMTDAELRAEGVLRIPGEDGRPHAYARIGEWILGFSDPANQFDPAGPNVTNPELQAQFDAMGLGIQFDHFLGERDVVLIRVPETVGKDQLRAALAGLERFAHVERNHLGFGGGAAAT